MKIIEIIPHLASGGAERFVVDLCNQLSGRNEVFLICICPLENGFGFYKHELYPSVRLIPLNVHIADKFKIMSQLSKVIMDIRPDIVHTHLSSVNYIPYARCRNRYAKFYHTVHNDASKEAGRFSFIRKFFFKKHWIEPVTISIESQNSFRNFYKMDSARIDNGRSLPQTIEVSDRVIAEFTRYKPSDETKVIVCLARIVPEKRQVLLAQIAARLKSEGYDFSILFIGNNSLYPELSNQLLSYRNEYCHILGERKNPLEYLALADAFCLFSQYEGLPISLIEALGVGCIPVCTPVGGIPNLVVSGENGILAADISEESCYNALKTFLSMDEAVCKKMRQMAKKSFRPFDMVHCAEKYMHLFGGETL